VVTSEDVLAPLENIVFLHDAEELFLVYLTVTIAVRFIEHLLQCLVCEAFTQNLGDPFQVFE